MSKHINTLKILAILAIVSILAGCTGAAPTAQPTEDPAAAQATIAAVQTQAAATVVAGITANAPEATATSEPTATTEPTATSEPQPTETIAQPTVTQAPPTPTWAPLFTNTPPGTVTATFTTTPSSYSCTITESSPEVGYDLAPGTDFDASWTAKNTGTNTWLGSEVDIKYVSGTKMHEGSDLRDLPGDVAKDSTFKFILDMIAPNEVGRYTSTWAMVQGSTTLCTFTVTIDVVED